MSKGKKRVTVTSPTNTGEPAPSPLEAMKAGLARINTLPVPRVEGETEKVITLDGKARRVRVTKLPSGDNQVVYLD